MASALEHYVNNVRSLSSTGNFRELIEYLNGTSDLLAKNGNILDNVLETVDVQQHSLGVLYVLVAKLTNLSNSTTDGENVIKLVREFIQGCNGEQVRHAPQAYAELCHLFTNYIIKSGTLPIQAIKVLAQAVDKIRLFDSQLTPVHADLFQLSLCAKVFNPALKFLDIDITGTVVWHRDICAAKCILYRAISTTEDNNHDAKYFLLYYYYGGMIYSAVKNYERALYFFEVAVSTPALAMSYIMLESYKKYILVSLILEGKISNIPKYSSQVITRFIKPLSHAYHDLATAYETSQSDEVRNVINKYRDVFVRDVNLGLVKQVAASLYKKNIQRLTQTFLTLSLVDVANKVHLSGPNDAEKYILDMIKSGEIFASINQKDGMVVFKDDPEKYNTPEMFQSIREDITKVMELNKQIVKMEEEIKLNPHFVKKSIGNQDEDLVSCPTKSFPPNDQME